MVTCQPPPSSMGAMSEATTASTAPRWLDAEEQAAWRAYLNMNALVTARLNKEMQDETGVSISDFSVLVALSEHPEGRMRVLELAPALGWEKSRLSHQLTRMQQRGLVERSNCSEDRRGGVLGLLRHGGGGGRSSGSPTRGGGPWKPLLRGTSSRSAGISSTNSAPSRWRPWARSPVR